MLRKYKNVQRGTVFIKKIKNHPCRVKYFLVTGQNRNYYMGVEPPTQAAEYPAQAME